MHLVDATLPFCPVYSTYHHEYLGYLMTAHVVQILPSGELSFVHQGLYPHNIAEFSQELDEDDKELVKLISEMTPKAIVKKFGGDPRNELEFFSKKFEGQAKKLVTNFIQRRMARILPLCKGKALFEMGNDGYPAKQKITILDEQATALFHFRKKENFTRYYPTVKLNGEIVKFQKTGAALLCLEPAWMLLNHELFTFKKHVDGKKLRPFLRKDFIAIPKEKEEEYYRKFITQIIEKYDVYAKGFEIKTLRYDPEFILKVKEYDASSFSFLREVKYGQHCIPLESEGKVKSIMEKNGEEYRFFRIERKCQQEKEMLEFFEQFTPNKNSLSPWEYIQKDKALSWFSEHADFIRDKGVNIIQENPSYQISLDIPQIELKTQESGDWFDIKAIVRIGKFEIPFIKFRGHILKGNREYKLPDDSIAILPEHWFSDYRHLLEVSEVDESDGGSLKIKKYQAPLLNFPSKGNNGHSKMLDSIKNTEGIPEIPTPRGLKAKLRSYQEAGYNWLHFMKAHNMGGILADDMGLGKTLQTLSLLLKEKEDGIDTPSLIVLPTSLIPNWANEAKKFTPSLKIFTHTGINRPKDAGTFADYDLILTTYGLVRQDIKLLATFPFNYIILDESQNIKNPESKTAKAVRKLVAKHRLSLSGTPIENTVMDIWSQMSFLNPGLLGSDNFFKKFYVQPIEKNFDTKQSAKLSRIIYPYILRRRKHQVEKELPPRIEKLHYCEMTDEQKDFYEDTRSSYRNYLMDLITQGAWKKNKLNILAGLQKLRQIAIHPRIIEPEKFELENSGKYQEVKRLLKQILGKKRSKVLIFSQFVKVLTLLRNDLDKEGIKYNYLDGGTKDRQTPVDTFQNDKDIKVFLISLKAGGVGLNLTAADYVFILDPWWNPAVENQAIDRSHRIGQTRTVFYYKFITRDSIEEKILNLQRKKAKLSDDIIQVDEEVYKSLEASDLEDLLK
ncbi:MAG: DEAD/DEAH box helicase [Bacteroidia bacterium]|nr:DEAD/DEAH box helicase [Bacteroidia bacterium]